MDNKKIGQKLGVNFASINVFYKKRAKESSIKPFTVPAFNIRGLTYDTARTLFKTAKKLNTDAFVIEIARSEMNYSKQNPEEFATCVIAAAIKENYTWPIYLQGDHFQAKAKSPGIADVGEMEALKKLISEAVAEGFYNIDIDTSTLVDLGQKTIQKQQLPNILATAELTDFIRTTYTSPNYPTISIGGEIGHIGGKNSTAEEFEIFMQGVESETQGAAGLSKISIQTGTSHGGMVDDNGNILDVEVDFALLKNISLIAKNKFNMAGAVQHGASTLPDNLFRMFPKNLTAEIHLATGTQNIIFDHPLFPETLKKGMDSWVLQNLQKERMPGWNNEQTIYKLRKKTWGQFKKDLWEIDANTKKAIFADLQKRFIFLFAELGISDVKTQSQN